MCLWGDLNLMCQYSCWSIWVLIHVCDYSEVVVILFFPLTNNGPLKGHVSNFTLWYINTSLTYLLSSTHPIHFSFRYVSEKSFDIWKGLDWYFWPMCLWKYCKWLGSFWWWKVLIKFMLAIGSIMAGDRVIVI